MSEIELPLPFPPDGAPKDDQYAWMTACMFLVCCRGATDVEKAKALAALLILEDTTDGRNPDVKERAPLYYPHIERALGRPLTEDEKSGRRLIAEDFAGLREVPEELAA